jgi:hypothetical protein
MQQTKMFLFHLVYGFLIKLKHVAMYSYSKMLHSCDWSYFSIVAYKNVYYLDSTFMLQLYIQAKSTILKKSSEI